MTTDIQPDLLPCPFCGDRDEYNPSLSPVQGYAEPGNAAAGLIDTGWLVECDKCTGLGPCRKTRVEAITAWNTRLTSTTPTLGNMVDRVALEDAIAAGYAAWSDCDSNYSMSGTIAEAVIDLLSAAPASPIPTSVNGAGVREALPSHPREGVRPAYTDTMMDLLDTYEQRVWVWAQGCYVDSISQRSIIGDSYSESQRDDVGKARSALIRQIDALTTEPETSSLSPALDNTAVEVLDWFAGCDNLHLAASGSSDAWEVRRASGMLRGTGPTPLAALVDARRAAETEKAR